MYSERTVLAGAPTPPDTATPTSPVTPASLLETPDHWSGRLQPYHTDDLEGFLDPETAPIVAGLLQERAVKRGTVLFRMGDEPDGMYRIVSGQVKLQRDPMGSLEGRESVLTVFGPGQIFGNISIVDPGPRSATAVALTDCILRFLTRDDALFLLRTEPSFAFTMMSQLGRRLRLTHNAISALVLGDVPGKVARVITQMAARFGQRLPDGTIKVYHGMTQVDVAAMIGASREAVNKAMADFAQRGWVEPKTKGFRVLDYERLVHRAGDPDWEKTDPKAQAEAEPGAGA